MLLPLPLHLCYSGVTRSLQRLELIVWHLGERHDPLEKKRLGTASG
jgi:hypothetical protein